MDCRILEIEAQDGVITAARYLCSYANVQTEGWWHFKKLSVKAFEQITEEDVISWIEAEAGESIQKNLQEQAARTTIKTPAPWLPQTFKPSL